MKKLYALLIALMIITSIIMKMILPKKRKKNYWLKENH